MCRTGSFSLLCHRVSRLGDRAIVSGIIYLIKQGQMWGCAEGLWPTQDDLEPLRPLVPRWEYSTVSSSR